MSDFNFESIAKSAITSWLDQSDSTDPMPVKHFAPVENLGKVLVFLKPTHIPPPNPYLPTVDQVDLSGYKNKIFYLKTQEKTLPGFEDSETWNISNDDPTIEISKVITGKLGNLTRLDYTIGWDAAVLKKLMDLHACLFDVINYYRTPALKYDVAVVAKRCALINPAGGASASANAGSGNQTVSFQPQGGGLLKDCLEITIALSDVDVPAGELDGDNQLGGNTNSPPPPP